MPLEAVTINLALAYRYKPVELRGILDNLGLTDGVGSVRDISDFLLRTAVNNHPKYLNGMPKIESLMWADILNMLDDRTDTLELTPLHFRWLYELVTAFDYRAVFSAWRRLLLNELDRAWKAAEEAMT